MRIVDGFSTGAIVALASLHLFLRVSFDRKYVIFLTFDIDAASIVPWIVVPVIVVAICVTMVVIWRRKTAAERDRRGSSFKASIIKRMRTQSTNSQF